MFNKVNCIKRLKKELKQIELEQKTLLKDGYLRYAASHSHSKKRSQFRDRHAMERDFRLLRINKLVRALKSVIKNLKSTHNYTAIFTHLLILQEQNEIAHELNTSLEKDIKALTPLVKKAEKETDSFGNIGVQAEFESLLALRMLEELDPSMLEKINQRLIDYLKDNYETLKIPKESVIASALTHYKIPFRQDCDPINALILLLERPLQTIDEKNIPQTVCESFVLHLLMFNYLHIYEPHIAKHDEEKVKLIQQRSEYHRSVRPKKEFELFNEFIRGRRDRYSVRRDSTLGICDDDYALDIFENFHRFSYTPFKYRTAANESSPLVKHLRKKGIPFIAGPSGTTADVIEGLQFLYPEMSDADYQAYLNLLAASEVALGHHSFVEVILTACNAGVLPQVRLKDIGQPIWEQIDYATMYKDFLSNQFKQTEAYQVLFSQYPWCLGEVHPLVKRKKIKAEQKRRLANMVQKALEGQVAESIMIEAPYWKDYIDFSEAPKPPHFLAKLSHQNIERLRQLTADLKPVENTFLHFFVGQPISLTHYTNASREIKHTGHLLSNQALREQGILFKSSSLSDIDSMQNDKYVFFRFELEHRPFSSRFGKEAITLDGRDPNLYPYLWVSLTDMFEPLDPTPIDVLFYDDDVIVREGKSLDDESEKENDEDEFSHSIQFRYPQTGETAIFNVPEHVFAGSDIMEGLARSLIIELRRIGGSFQTEALSPFQNAMMLLNQEQRPFILSHLNKLLSSVFRVEGKIPRSVALQQVPYVQSSVSALYESIREHDLIQFRKQIRHIPPQEINSIGEKLLFEIILNHNEDQLQYLLANGYKLNDDLVEYLLIQFVTTLHLSIPILSILFEYGYGQNLLNWRSYTGKSLLHKFAENGLTEQIDFLIEKGLSPAISNNASLSFIDCLSTEKQYKYRHQFDLGDIPTMMETEPVYTLQPL